MKTSHSVSAAVILAVSSLAHGAEAPPKPAVGTSFTVEWRASDGAPPPQKTEATLTTESWATLRPQLPKKARKQLILSNVGIVSHSVGLPLAYLGLIAAGIGIDSGLDGGGVGGLTASFVMIPTGLAVSALAPMAPITHLVAIKQLRSRGVDISPALAITSMSLLGAYAVSVPYGVSSHLGSPMFILSGALFVANIPVMIASHKAMRRGWVRAHRESVAHHTPRRRRVIVAPTVDIANRQLGLAGVW